MTDQLDIQTTLDALGHGVLIFASDGSLLVSNKTAGTLLGTDLSLIRDRGWTAAVQLFDAGLSHSRPEDMLDGIRNRALESDRPVRFHIFRSGEYIPCWAAPITVTDGNIHTMLTLDVQDWTFVGQVIDRFRKEMVDAVDTTIGHINLINKTLNKDEDDEATRKIGRRIGGFTRLIAIHMDRAGRLMHLLERLEDVRTGRLQTNVRESRTRINMEDYMEDFLEELDEIELLDPETEIHDYRSRIHTILPDNLMIDASPRYLTYTLQELLRNAIMYSLRGTPITIKAQVKSQTVQLDVIDEGYGIRRKEWERVFDPFARARQPQIISEFGYGLCLHLCRHEVTAMNGRLWFTSEENVGSTFSVILPLWQESASSTEST